MPESEKQLPDLLSKTQRKKDMHALQDIGARLATLADSQLAKLPLSEELLELIYTARKLKTHESKRRHMQLVGKRMRHEDIEAIQKALNRMK
jgi:ribosome-associated protein